MQQIQQMDMSPELRAGHCAGLLAAQLTLNYLDHSLFPIHERAIDMGTLAMLGCYITDRKPLTLPEMDYAERYQRVILFTRVLDDLQPDPIYNNRKHSSILCRAQQYIKLNHFFGYSEGRARFREVANEIVEDYEIAIRTTPPQGEDIAMYRQDNSIAAVVDRFLKVRHSLQNYVPRLIALDEELWRYARSHYARYLKYKGRHRSTYLDS